MFFCAASNAGRKIVVLISKDLVNICAVCCEDSVGCYKELINVAKRR